MFLRFPVWVGRRAINDAEQRDAMIGGRIAFFGLNFGANALEASDGFDVLHGSRRTNAATPSRVI